MPTTIVGLLIFAALAIPGFAHLLAAERRLRPGRNVSAFREVATVALAGMWAWLATLALFGLGKLFVPTEMPSVRRLVREGRRYFREDYTYLSVWAVLLLLLASGLAFMWAAHNLDTKVRGLVKRIPIIRLLLPKYGAEFESAWWRVFIGATEDETADAKKSANEDENDDEPYRRVKCRLTDGCLNEGWLLSFNRDSDDVVDRDLILSAPIYISYPDGSVSVETGAIVLSARNIAYLHVDYIAPADGGGPPQEELSPAPESGSVG
jgi:hypothetical protein